MVSDLKKNKQTAYFVRYNIYNNNYNRIVLFTNCFLLIKDKKSQKNSVVEWKRMTLNYVDIL